jgi:hypothetical protein
MFFEGLKGGGSFTAKRGKKGKKGQKDLDGFCPFLPFLPFLVFQVSFKLTRRTGNKQTPANERRGPIRLRA